MNHTMPTTKMLLVFSGVMFVLGGLLLLVAIIFHGIPGVSLPLTVLWGMASVLAGALLRALAKIGQLLYQVNLELSGSLRGLHEDLVSLQYRTTAQSQDLSSFLAEKLTGLGHGNEAAVNHAVTVLGDKLSDLRDLHEQLNCDTKDMVENLHRLYSDLQRSSGDMQQTGQHIRQINEFLLKMRQHIEAQQ